MSIKTEIKISVRNLIEFILRAGDINTGFVGSSRAVEGTRAHQKVQKENSEEGYMPEVTLKHQLEYKNFNFLIEGRADGIIINKDVTIDEIKSTSRPLSFIDEGYNILHLAQAKCYAYIYSKQNSLEEINVQLTYFQLETEEIKKFKRKFVFEELEDFFFGLLDKYLVWANFTDKWIVKRDTSIKNMDFPFEKYRKGQRELAVYVYKTIAENKKIFLQAPTGIGKTISTLFPAVKAIAEGKTSKIFYLTAKTVIKGVVEEAFEKMKEKGLQFKTVTITAKEKICFKEEKICNPEYCEFAKGHFDRVNDALLEIMEKENYFTRAVIEEYSKLYQVCPFEFSLDLALWADCIICDYNYVFDPRIYLKRFFLDNSGNYTFLIDESHNLVDRARGMFSAELYKKNILELKKLMKEEDVKISKALNSLNSFMLNMKKLCGENKFAVQKEEPKDIYPLLMKFTGKAEEWLLTNEKNEQYEKLLELYFNALTFLRIAEFYDEKYVTYVENSKGDTKIKLFCLDPSYLLSEAVKRGKSSIFFSATLMPMDYFCDVLGGTKEDYKVRLDSPFNAEKRGLYLVNTISTRYINREKSYTKLVEYIKKVIDKKTGNYITFFPSYNYMNEIYKLFSEKYPEVNLKIQQLNMTEEERTKFLKLFQPNPKQSVLGFCVLGGIFSEGIDLKHDRLIGAIIVGVGLPQICMERDIIKSYFQKKNGMGYEYAYMYPGMNKVLQAAGRVIRTEKDRGVIVLIDERFAEINYIKLFPKEWFPNTRVKKLDYMEDCIEKFWNKS